MAGPPLTQVLHYGERVRRPRRALLDLIVTTASGQPTCAERNGARELAIWKTGVTL
jgi:altronate hydrolase